MRKIMRSSPSVRHGLLLQPLPGGLTQAGHLGVSSAPSGITVPLRHFREMTRGVGQHHPDDDDVARLLNPRVHAGAVGDEGQRVGVPVRGSASTRQFPPPIAYRFTVRMSGMPPSVGT